MSRFRLPHHPPSFTVKLLSSAVALALLGGASHSLAQAPEVEEVVVTGSYIRRSAGIVAASPLTQLSAEDLEAQGTVNMAQVAQNLTFNNGTAVTNSIQGATSTTSNFNLRGLGPRATLTLIDGKRVASDNVQTMLPASALQRMEIVTDGAAALYGTDAVAGVVNLIPYTSYDGLKVEIFNEGDSRGSFERVEGSFLTGKSFGDVDVVFAGSQFSQSTLAWQERPDYIRAGLTHNGGGNPGNYTVPQRDANGDLTGETGSRADPNCGYETAADQTSPGNNPWGNLLGGRCFMSFGDTRDFQPAADTTSFYGNLNWDISSDVTFHSQLIYNRQRYQNRNNPSNPGARTEALNVVRGELPGNTFRAKTSAGQELFAEPLRNEGGAIVLDGYDRPMPMRDASGQVVFANDRFSSIDNNPLGGVAFAEDVYINGAQWVPFNRQAANTVPTAMQEFGYYQQNQVDHRTYRLATGLDFAVPMLEGWQGSADYVYGVYNNVGKNTQQYSLSAVNQGLNCDVINDVDSCYNPFGAVDSRFRTPQAVADSIYTADSLSDKNELQTFNLIFNGEVPLGDFELPGGPVSMAIGYQRREEKEHDGPTATSIRDDQLIGSQALPRTQRRSSDSWFAEFALPVMDNMELSAAIRDESFSTGQGAVVTKLGIVYVPTEWMSLRATKGEAFIVPTLTQLNSPEACGLSNVDDLFSPFQGFITSCRSGNPNLASESSDSLSLGADFSLMDNLSWSITWSETDFADRIVSTTTQDIIRTDYKNFQAATGFVATDANPYPDLALLQTWVNDPRSDRRIVRNAADITTPDRILQNDSNASTMLVRAWDTQIDYGFSLDDVGLDGWGNIDVQLQGTYMDTYQFQLEKGGPVREAVGGQNNNYGAVPTIPKIRANLRVNWRLGNHTVSATTRYIDEVSFDANEFSFQKYFPGSEWRGGTEVLRAWTQLDMFYSYRGYEALGGDFSFSVGARNLTDRMPQKTGMIAGVAAESQDVLGRVVYARVNFSL
jgi:iron complex outermembrane receptor protein